MITQKDDVALGETGEDDTNKTKAEKLKSKFIQDLGELNIDHYIVFVRDSDGENDICSTGGSEFWIRGALETAIDRLRKTNINLFGQ